MTPGLAAEFIQPWYSPLACTPATTGLPFGGIGSAITLTPAGTTPVLHFLPGIQVRGREQGDIRLSNFFYRESTLAERTKLRISDFGSFMRKDQFYPLVDLQGKSLFAGVKDSAGALKRIQTVLQEPGIFEANREKLQRWGIEWSDRTQNLIDQNQTDSAVFNKLWLIDFFDGILGFEANAQGSLTADWFEKSIAGQPTFPSAGMNYRALYPAASTEYRKSGKAKITRSSWSPVFPDEERLSSLPVGYSLFEIHNPTASPLEVTVVQSLANLVGSGIIKDRPGVQDASFILQPLAKNPTAQPFDMDLGHGRLGRGILLGQAEPSGDLRGTMAAAVSWNSKDGVTASVKPYYYTTQESVVVEGALVSGRVCDTFVKNVYSGREVLCSALCATAVVAPGATVELTFGLCVDFAEISMPGILSSKKYVSYFPKEVGRAQEILHYALSKEPELRGRLSAEYGKILPKGSLKKLFPKGGEAEERFRTMAYNTLGFLTEATVWDEADRFLVRECADYPFFNSLDVYFYGSFGLLTLMPRVDGAVMRRFSEAVLAANAQVRRHHEYVNHPWADLPDPKLEGPRGVRGAVIHDLGSPFDARPDAYDWHNVKEWKDLTPKFVLMVLRHFKVTGDQSVLRDCKEAVYASMEYLERMIEPGQKFPLTHGTDDTFDNLSSHGVSVYCGTLWIAGLRAAAAIARALGDEAKAKNWDKAADDCVPELDAALWDNARGYYHFFATPVQIADLIPQKVSALAGCLPGVVSAGSDAVQALGELNSFLWNDKPIPASLLVSPKGAPLVAITSNSKKNLRTLKKNLLAMLAKDCLAASFQKRIGLESDDVFADQLLADTWLRMLGLKPISSPDKAKKALQAVYRLNYKVNSPRVGAANLVHPDGSPLEESNFQAHDVWIGVQHSIACAMVIHGLSTEARDLEESMYQNLCVEARIPFSAPEGFNATVRVKPELLVAKLGIKEPAAKKLVAALLLGKVLTEDFRVAPSVPRKLADFSKKFGAACKVSKADPNSVFELVHHTGLKYTAGRYFRPGMVWALPMVSK
jgi:uncharacterized protein (DUF608 family)